MFSLTSLFNFGAAITGTSSSATSFSPSFVSSFAIVVVSGIVVVVVVVVAAAAADLLSGAREAAA